jgi:MFS family permease
MFAALKKRNFALLWLEQLVSLCGDALLIIAVPYFVYQLTGSVLQTGLAVVAQTLPAVLLSSFAGVFVDRWNRRVTMLAADLLRAAILLLMMHHLISQGFAYCTGIRTMPIGRHLLWSMTNYRESLLEKLFGGIHVPLFALGANPPDCHRDQ